MVGGLWDLKGPLASHSRRASLGTLAPSAPCFGSFAAKKRYLIVFSCSPTPSSVGRGGAKHTVAKEKADALHLLFLLVAEVGFEPHDLRVMSPTSYQAALLRDIVSSLVVPVTGIEPVRYFRITGF